MHQQEELKSNFDPLLHVPPRYNLLGELVLFIANIEKTTYYPRIRSKEHPQG